MDGRGCTPLHTAAANGHPPVVSLLLMARAQLEARDRRGETPLLAATTASKAIVVAMLLQRGADVNATTTEGWTALHKASNNEDLAAMLIKHGADLTATGPGGMTPAGWPLLFSFFIQPCVLDLHALPSNLVLDSPPLSEFAVNKRAEGVIKKAEAEQGIQRRDSTSGGAVDGQFLIGLTMGDGPSSTPNSPSAKAPAAAAPAAPTPAAPAPAAPTPAPTPVAPELSERNPFAVGDDDDEDDENEDDDNTAGAGPPLGNPFNPFA